MSVAHDQAFGSYDTKKKKLTTTAKTNEKKITVNTIL